MKDAILTYLGEFPFKEFMLSVILVNFAIELAVNVVLAPAISTVTNIVEKQILKRHPSKNNQLKEEEI